MWCWNAHVGKSMSYGKDNSFLSGEAFQTILQMDLTFQPSDKFDIEKCIQTMQNWIPKCTWVCAVSRLSSSNFNVALHKCHRMTDYKTHQLDSERVCNPLWIKSCSGMNQRHSGAEIIDTRDYADLRNTLCIWRFSECKLHQPWKQEALHHYGRRDKAGGG